MARYFKRQLPQEAKAGNFTLVVSAPGFKCRQPMTVDSKQRTPSTITVLVAA